MRMTQDQRLAMEVMLTNLLGARDYDRLCLGMKVEKMEDDILYVVIPNRLCATEIRSDHSDDFAVAAEHALDRPVRCVCFL